MRTLIAGSLLLISFVFLSSLTAVPAVAQEACTCKGCGCKGGPGWRAPNGYCVSAARLTKICGSPPGAPCTQENTERVCLRNTAAEPQVEVKTETP
jgi:hypothetical protein